MRRRISSAAWRELGQMAGLSGMKRREEWARARRARRGAAALLEVAERLLRAAERKAAKKEDHEK